MTLSIRNIIPIIKANWFGNNDISIIDTISIDSRSLQNGENTLFFAISGPNHDGHQYIEELISKGVQNFVVTHFDENLKSKANFLVVENPVHDIGHGQAIGGGAVVGGGEGPAQHLPWDRAPASPSGGREGRLEVDRASYAPGSSGAGRETRRATRIPSS